MLVQFSVRNYLSFKDVNTISLLASSLKDKHVLEDDVMFSPYENSKLKLLKSASIYGANASGKSNFVKAMIFFRWFVINSSKETQAEESIDITNYRLSTLTENKPSFFEIIFFWNQNQYRYGFEADSKKVVSEWLFSKSIKPKSKEIELFFREEGLEPIIHDKFSIAKELVEKNMIRANALLLSVAAQFNDKVSLEIFQWIRSFNVISGLKDEQYTGYTINLLQNTDYKERIIAFTKYADLGIDDLQIVSNEISDVKADKSAPEIGDALKKSLIGKKMNTLMSFHQKFDENLVETDLIPFHFNQSESQGTIKYFSLAGPILDTLDNGRILVIDELDSKLHPLLTQKIINLFNSKFTNPKNAQLIFTSHDTNLLDVRLFRRDQIWFTQKDRYGATELYSLSEYKVRNDASFEKDYLHGKYGAVPSLRDYKKLFNLKIVTTDGK